MGELQRVAVAKPTLAPARATEQSAVRGPSLVRRTIQTKLTVGATDDAFEREAERTADAVMAPNGALQFGGGSIRPSGIAASLMRFAQRALGKAEMPTKKDDDDKKKVAQKESAGAGPSVAPLSVEHSIDRMSAGGGSPLAPALRTTFEPRFGYDFGDVRTHASGEASHAATALGARAFTVGDHIFFAAGEYQPTSAQGQRLIAHELTHTIQQKPTAARASRMLAISSSAPVSAAPKRVQRLFDDTKKAVRDKVKEYITRDFPPWDLITLIIGWDPIAEKPVKGATRDWIRAAMKLVPEGESLFDKLDKEGKIDSVAKWWDTQVAKLDLSMAKVIALANQAWDAVGIADVTDPAGAWNKKIKPIFAPTVTRVWAFVKEVGEKILAVVKDLVLTQVGEWARKQKGYPLLTMILGKDPVTGEEVKPTLKGVIFAVLDLIDGGDKIKENLEKSKTVEKAAAWFKAEVKKLDLTWEGIKALFTKAWDAFKVIDLLNPKLLFEKMAAIFGPSVMRLLSFLVAVGKKVLEFIFEGAMLIAGPIGLQIVGIVKKVGDTFNKIVDDPVAFIGHLVDAVKKGIGQFAKNIWEHLKTGLIGWLTGTLEGAGLVLPKVWDLKGILDLVLQILGITYAKIRVKLVKVLGEKTVGMLERVFAFIKTLVTEGPAAAWQRIVEAIGGLWDLVIGGIKDWAVTKIVTAAITKLATMLNPAGAIIQAIIATYNTIAFFIERIKQILDFVEAIVDSIANIANGKIAAAANWVEKAMARSIPVLLGFLARLIGLGDVSEAVKKVITAIQVKVDKGIDFVIDWVVKKAKSLFGGKEDVGEPAQPGKQLTPEEATKVKATALDDAEKSLRGSKLHSIAEMQVVLTSTYNKHKPAGLKSLSIHVTNETTLAFDVVATASDPERRTLKWDDAFAPDDEAKALFETQPRYETNAAVSINGARFGETSASDDQGHAEQNLIRTHWKNVLKQLADNKAKGVKSTVVVAINRAPCHTRCTSALIDAIGQVPSDVRASTNFILAPTGTYEPTQNLDEEGVEAAAKRYDEVRKKLRSADHEVEGYTIVSKAKLTEHATRMSDLSRLSAAGWDLHQLQVKPKPTSAGVVLAEAAHKLAVKAGLVKAGAA